jgi:hypothetical protein
MCPSANELAGGRSDAPEHLGPSPLVVIGNPENRRVQMFRAAAERLSLPAPQIVPYEAVLSGRLDVRRAIEPGSLVRIDSPGENETVERALVALGAAQHRPAELPADYVPGEIIEHGRIYHPGLWYRGFCHLLAQWEAELEPLGVRWMNHPADIRLMFHKNACQEFLEQERVPVPRRLGAVRSYDELRAAMRAAGQSRVFLKLSHGSSASGVVALQAGRGRISAVTSVEVVRSNGHVRLYNSLRLRNYRRESDVADLVNALGPLGTHLEAWLPKAGSGGTTFDLRIMTIAGEVRHCVMRTSRGPITNLHLGNRRGDAERLLQELPAGSRHAAWETCERVAALFPRSLHIGIDLMFAIGFRRHAVLELNAFGDLLPGVLDREQDTYTAELAAALAVGDG